ncbi:hypothetical protein WA026_017475 [Henosepilachna vigintioctopunctata]|uniref:Uncharacterized protein n=1 Tax=Henosepilachna vigintioctopunctata TaxID=420089 RepID=A0AAW1VHT2_9CUCU
MIKTNSENWAEDFLSILAPSSVNKTLPEYTDRSNPTNFPVDPFTLEEIITASSYHNNSSPGSDNIHYSMIYHLPKRGKNIFLKILNRFWNGQKYRRCGKIR